MTTSDLISPEQQTREEWLQWRRRGIGASDVAALVNLSPWDSPWSIWADKVGILPPKETSEVMEAGHYLERAIVPWFEDRTGLRVVSEQDRCERPGTVGQCTVDGLVAKGSGAVEAALEIKTAQPGKAWTEIPVHYQCQGQWQMYVTGLPRVYFAVLMGRRLDVHILERDQADIDMLAETAEKFWVEHVMSGVPPEVDGHEATLEALKATNNTSVPESSVDLADEARWVEVLRKIKETIKISEKLENEAAAHLRAALGDAEAGLIGDHIAITLKPQQSSRLDVERLRAAHPDLVKEFTNTKTIRVLRATKEKAA